MSALPQVPPEAFRLVHSDLTPLKILVVDYDAVSALALPAIVQQLSGLIAG